MSILSIQSHVVYGYVGNKVATYPLQCMGYDVWPINTVQFSNHTGYGKWQGEIFSHEQILDLAKGIEDIEQAQKCEAILSGYMGDDNICRAVQQIVKMYKSINSNLIYLCDPVIGNDSCYVKPEVLDFFKYNLSADIITPNQNEAEILSGIKVCDVNSLKAIAKYFHEIGIKTVVITGAKITEMPDGFFVFASDNGQNHLIKINEYNFSTPVNGSGDLFSALYLGYYLKNKEAFISLQQTVYFVQKVLYNTYKLNERELQILSEKYTLDNVHNLPPIINL